jgi:hypothetical protein
MSDIIDQIKKALVKYPTLSIDGFAVGPKKPLPPEKKLCQIELNQQCFLRSSDQVSYVVSWLSNIEKTQNINSKCGSYALKHLAGKNFPGGYISNGAFILGSVIAGFKVKQKGPNGFFNMPTHSFSLKTS